MHTFVGRDGTVNEFNRPNSTAAIEERPLKRSLGGRPPGAVVAASHVEGSQPAFVRSLRDLDIGAQT